MDYSYINYVYTQLYKNVVFTKWGRTATGNGIKQATGPMDLFPCYEFTNFFPSN